MQSLVHHVSLNLNFVREVLTFDPPALTVSRLIVDEHSLEQSFRIVNR